MFIVALADILTSDVSDNFIMSRGRLWGGCNRSFSQFLLAVSVMLGRKRAASRFSRYVLTATYSEAFTTLPFFTRIFDIDMRHGASCR
jgi:hypothetical protein